VDAGAARNPVVPEWSQSGTEGVPWWSGARAYRCALLAEVGYIFVNIRERSRAEDNPAIVTVVCLCREQRMGVQSLFHSFRLFFSMYWGAAVIESGHSFSPRGELCAGY
jgi:hypothetical protein